MADDPITCPDCGQEVTLRADGTITLHGLGGHWARPPWCPGSGRTIDAPRQRRDRLPASVREHLKP